jgi:hypothetical protein
MIPVTKGIVEVIAGERVRINQDVCVDENGHVIPVKDWVIPRQTLGWALENTEKGEITRVCLSVDMQNAEMQFDRL